MAPAAGVVKNAMSAVSTVRMDQLGCHVSAWKLLIERQILVEHWKRPDGVNSMMSGGLKGYCDGSRMRPWYRPPA